MLKQILNTTKTTIKIIQKSPIVWVIFLLLIPIFQVINFRPLMLLRNFLTLYISNIRWIALSLSKVITAVIAFTIIFAIIMIIVKKVTMELHESFLLTLKKYCFSIVILMLTILLPLNFGVEILSESIMKAFNLTTYFGRYFLTLIKCIFFYYILHIWVDKEIYAQKKFLAQLKPFFSWRIILELLLMVLLLSAITTPFFYYPLMKFQEALQQNLASGFFLSLMTEYRNPLWYEALNLFLAALIHKFLIVYTAVLYYERIKDVDSK